MLSAKERAALSVGERTSTPRPDLPEYVHVRRIDNTQLAVRDDYGRLLYQGNESQVHNWLGRNNYLRIRYVPGSWVEGQFKKGIAA